MLAWQHSWFSSYLQGDDGRLGLLLLSLDIISSLKLQAEIICALMRGSQKEPGNCIPQQHSWYLPSMLPSPALWGGQWGMLRQTGSASQLLETRPAPAARPQDKVPHAPRTGQWPWTRTKLGCLHAPCLRAGAEQGQHGSCGKLSANSLSSLCEAPFLCFVYCGSRVRDPCFMSGHICATNTRAKLRHPFLQFCSSQVFLIAHIS